MLENWPHICRVKIMFALLLTNLFISTTTNSMKCCVNWISLRIRVLFFLAFVKKYRTPPSVDLNPSKTGKAWAEYAWRELQGRTLEGRERKTQSIHFQKIASSYLMRNTIMNIERGSSRDVQWRGLGGTCRLIRDWNYFLTFCVFLKKLARPEHSK